ncbi:MAG: choice-of-anchor D domain-containing protein [Pseudomonadota bacterium]
MSGSPLPAPSIGLFINVNQGIWSTTNEAKGTKSCTYSGGNLVVSGPNGTLPTFTAGTKTVRHKFFGTNDYLAVLIQDTNAGPKTATVLIIDFVSPTIQARQAIMTSIADGQIPFLQFSMGTGSVCLIGASDGSQLRFSGILRSDTGEVVCPFAGPLMPSGQVLGEVVAAGPQIKEGGTVIAGPCPLPQGKLQISPSSRNFGSVPVGGCPQPPSTQQFTITNNGTDCTSITGIQDSAPYSVVNLSASLPAALDPGQTLTVTVAYQPVVVGTNNNFTLPVTATQNDGGDTSLVCNGQAVQAMPDCTVTPSSVNFGTVPVGSSATQMVTITNTGAVDLTINVPAPGAGPFQWTLPGSPALPCGASVTLTVTYMPVAEMSDGATISITTPPGDPKNINLTGMGCIPNAAIIVPPSFPGFGEVRQGFRTVRIFDIDNTGDDTLTFQARIEGPDAALFGVLNTTNSITDVSPSRTFSVEPVTRCGPGATGTGKVTVAVAFHADGAPPLSANANLVIDMHNDASAAPAFVLPLSAEVIAGNTVDAVAVLDRSGSMGDAVPGGGTKMQAAIQAGRLLVNLLPPDLGNRVAATSYAADAVTFLGMDEITAVNQPAKVGDINAGNPDLIPGGSTAIAAGAIVGAKEFDVPRAGPAPAELVKAMIVLTDGMDNTAYLNPDDNQHYSLTGGPAQDPANGFALVPTLPWAAPSDVDVYGVGLGTGEDIDIGQLAALSSAAGGYYGTVDPTQPDTAFQLMKFYTQIYMDLVDTSTIEDPRTTIKPGERHVYPFDVLRGDVTGMVVVYDLDGQRLPFWLETPQGEIIDPAQLPPGFALRAGATEAARFLDFVLPAKEPKRYAGRWNLVVVHEGEVCLGPVEVKELEKRGFQPRKCRDSKDPVEYGFAIGVGSNFRLQAYVGAGTVKVGEAIDLSAQPTEAGLFASGMTVTVEARAPNGQTWTGIKLTETDQDGGDYVGQFTKTQQGGSYTFIFRATGVNRDGEPVKREVVRSKYVEGLVRKPPETGRPGGGDGGFDKECCERILRALKTQTELLSKLSDR